MDSLGLFGSMLGHIGDGNFHETILYDGNTEKQKVEKCVHDMVRRALEMDGTCTVSSIYSGNAVSIDIYYVGRAWSWSGKEGVLVGRAWTRNVGSDESHQKGFGSVLVDESWQDLRCMISILT